MPGQSAPSALLSRRRVLALAAMVGLSAGLTACSQPPAAPEIPLEPDELAVNRAVAAARSLRTDALALAGTRPELAVLLRRVAAVHAEHLAALGSPIRTGPSASRSASAAAAATASASPAASAGPAPAPTAPTQIKAEAAAAGIALRDGLAAAPAFAVLLSRIAAARAVNADLLAAAAGRPAPGVLRPARAATAPTPSGTAKPSTAAKTSTATTAASPTAVPSSSGAAASTPEPVQSVDPADLNDPSTPAEIALDRLLAGEHAAVFAYPLIVARAAGNRRALASTLWQAHRTERDELSTLLLNAGIRSAVAEPAYDVGTPPASPAKAADLAARIERGLAALATDLLAAASSARATDNAAADGPSRSGPTGRAAAADLRLGADQLVLAARRTATWTGRPAAFPDLIARATPPTATATNSSFTPSPAATTTSAARTSASPASAGSASSSAVTPPTPSFLQKTILPTAP